MFNDVVWPELGLDAWFGVPDEALVRVADLACVDPNWPRQLHAKPWLQTPVGVPDVERVNSRARRQAVFGAVNLHTTATAMAEFFSRLTSEGGPVCELLGRRLPTELLASQVTGYDEVFGTEIPGRRVSYVTRGRLPRVGSAARPPGDPSGTAMPALA
ncbi:hypothetical protein ACWDSL_27125 [Streptomyces sp. NPDC000941]